MRAWARSEAGCPTVRAIAGHTADQIEIVDRVRQDFDAQIGREMGKQVPGRHEVEVDLDVDEAPQKPAVERVPHGEHHRRARLEVHRNGKATLR